MSGEPVALLVSQPSGTLVSLVRALAELESAGLPRHALIGGVAVMVRLSQAHRATQDLDEVVEPSSPTAAVLIAGPGAVETAGGVRVDLISVGDRDLGSLRASDLPQTCDPQRTLEATPNTATTYQPRSCACTPLTCGSHV